MLNIVGHSLFYFSINFLGGSEVAQGGDEIVMKGLENFVKFIIHPSMHACSSKHACMLG